MAAAHSTEPAPADAAIKRGNQAWITGMRTGNASLIADTYTDDAVDCGANGECARGRPAILWAIQDRLLSTGNASGATVMSAGSSRAGDLVYEWGSSMARFADGQKREGRYLTVWRRESKTWKIFRNLAISAEHGL
jgi:ketosteroid isomerase-like protein